MFKRDSAELLCFYLRELIEQNQDLLMHLAPDQLSIGNTRAFGQNFSNFIF